MDISYLLFLQDFRNSINDALTPFMEWISHFAVAYLFVVAVFIYWCIDKKKGLYTICSICLGVTLNSLIKLTACVYRPWIRDPRIIPAGDAITEATGYSFPSGHTITATTGYGSIAASFGKKHKLVGVICIVLLVITAFSRNYLGVHTPQDVAVAICEGVLCLILLSRLFAYLELHPEKENLLLVLGIILGAALMVYYTVKPYPMNYVDGKLLVDPKKMMIDGYKDSGLFMSFCLARMIEKKFVRFEAAGLNVKGILVSLLGILPFFAIYKMLPKVMVPMLGTALGGTLAQAVLCVFAVLVWPIVIRLVCGRSAKTSEAGA